MRILVLQDTNWIERGPHQQHHLMDRLSLEGHEIHVIDYDLLWKNKRNHKIIKNREELGNQPKTFSNAKITLIRPAALQIPILEYLAMPLIYWREIRRELHEFKPNVIVSFGIISAYIGVKVASHEKIPCAYYLIDQLHTLLPLKIAHPLAKLLESKTIKLSKRIFVINRGLADYAITMGASRDKIAIIPGGVDLNRYQIASQRRNEVRSKFNFNSNDIVLFFMGWLYAFSGLTKVALALSRIKTIYPHIKILIVGEGDSLSDLQKIKEKNALNEQLILTGRQPFGKIPELISASDICLLPADPFEPTMKNIVPIKIYEYMAEGKPIISTKLDGLIKEFGSNNGITFVDSPTEVLSEAIAMRENNKMNEEGLKAKNYVKGNDWGTLIKEFESSLEGMIHND